MYALLYDDPAFSRSTRNPEGAALKVLQSSDQNKAARAELKRRGLSHLNFDSWLMDRLYKKGYVTGLKVGERTKSWDVLQTVTYIEEHLSKDAMILDIGAYSSEILLILHRLRYQNLIGIDLNRDIRLMPYSGAIRYQVANFLASPFDDQTFDAITAISVIEHGFNGPVLFAEMSRLLRPGGSFLASFDYWPQKVHTGDMPLYGMEWRIFSREEIDSLIAEALRYGFEVVGDIDYGETQKPPIHNAGRRYTFAWLALRKHI